VYKGVEAAATYYVGSGFSLQREWFGHSAKAKDSGLLVSKVPKSTAALGLLYKANGAYGSLIAKGRSAPSTPRTASRPPTRSAPIPSPT